MITVEENFDESVVTVMDTLGLFEDVKMHFQEDVVYIAQYNKGNGSDELVQLSNAMWEQLIIAYNSTQGTYIVK